MEPLLSRWVSYFAKMLAPFHDAKLCSTSLVNMDRMTARLGPFWLPLVATVAGFWVVLAAFVRRNLLKLLKSDTSIRTWEQEVDGSNPFAPI
jgi:hypothetical protein